MGTFQDFQSAFVIVGFGALALTMAMLARDFKSFWGRVGISAAAVFFFIAFGLACVITAREHAQSAADEPSSNSKELSNGRMIRTQHPVPRREKTILGA